MKRLRTLLVGTSYPRDAGDWKGRFVFDQAAALARQGLALSLWAPPGELPTGVTSALNEGDAAWLARLLEAGGIAHLLRRKPFYGLWAGAQLLRRLRRACRRAGADIYFIDWLQNALALPDDGRPALLAVLGSDFRLLDLPGMCAALRRQMRRRKTILMPNAGWMAPRLRACFGDLAAVEPNPFGVAEAWFGVTRKPAPERRGWLVVSRITRAKLGGLLEWGEGLFSADAPLILLGPQQEQIALPGWIAHPGATHPQELQERWFPQARGLVTLSRHDEGRPQVVIEAMAAGLPVIASDIPAHADLIRHGETGWLVGSRETFAAALCEAADPLRGDSVGAAARRQIQGEIGTWDDCAKRYLAAMEHLRAG